MRTSSKGASEKRRLTQYVTNTVLDDNFKGTTEQFVLHFNEQFRQLDEISEASEKLPSTVKLTLLQTAVRSINDLRIVETLDEFQSTTYGHGSSTSLSYDTYYDLLINACVRYDKTKKANMGKRRNFYTTNIDDTYVDHPTACIDHVPNSSYGGIDLPPDEFYQVHTLFSRHPPSPRPGHPSRPSFRPQSQNSGPTKPIRRYDGPIFLPPQIYKLLSQDAMKALKAYNTEAINRFHQRKVHNTEIVETPQDDRIPSTTPGAEPPRDARDSGSARSHSTHLETSSSDRPKWSPTRSSTRYQDQISVTCTRWTLRMPSFTRATHAQPSLSNFTRRDSNFGERTRSRGTTLGEQNFPLPPKIKKTKLTHCSIYVPMRTISTSHAK